MGLNSATYCLMSHPLFHIKILTVSYFSYSLMEDIQDFLYAQFIEQSVSVKHKRTLSSVAYSYVIMYSYGQKFY
jgi:hypothetical protein